MKRTLIPFTKLDLKKWIHTYTLMRMKTKITLIFQNITTEKTTLSETQEEETERRDVIHFGELTPVVNQEINERDQGSKEEKRWEC